MRSRYRVRELEFAHFITSTIVGWLPVFTNAARCNLLIDALTYCREHKLLRIHAWVILDNHFHAIVSGPHLTAVMRDLKRHTARRILEQLKAEQCEWLLNQFARFHSAHKSQSEFQVWQEGFHPVAIRSDDMMLQKLEYLHQNPVARGLVSTPEHWRYSSAHEWCPGVAPLLRCDPWR
jgi:REP element-mobilizing transposase RayT